MESGTEIQILEQMRIWIESNIGLPPEVVVLGASILVAGLPTLYSTSFEDLKETVLGVGWRTAIIFLGAFSAVYFVSENPVKIVVKWISLILISSLGAAVIITLAPEKVKKIVREGGK